MVHCTECWKGWICWIFRNFRKNKWFRTSLRSCPQNECSMLNHCWYHWSFIWRSSAATDPWASCRIRLTFNQWSMMSLENLYCCIHFIWINIGVPFNWLYPYFIFPKLMEFRKVRKNRRLSFRKDIADGHASYPIDRNRSGGQLPISHRMLSTSMGWYSWCECWNRLTYVVSRSMWGGVVGEMFKLPFGRNNECATSIFVIWYLQMMRSWRNKCSAVATADKQWTNVMCIPKDKWEIAYRIWEQPWGREADSSIYRPSAGTTGPL